MDTTERLHFQFSLSCIGEGNGNPLQCSCLENPRDGGAWWAAVSGVAQSWTQLKQLSSSIEYFIIILIFISLMIAAYFFMHLLIIHIVLFWSACPNLLLIFSGSFFFLLEISNCFNNYAVGLMGSLLLGKWYFYIQICFYSMAFSLFNVKQKHSWNLLLSTNYKSEFNLLLFNIYYLRARGERGDRGWDGWMASLTQWAWVWANSRRQWRTGKPGVLQSMGSQKVRHDLVTEQQKQPII